MFEANFVQPHLTVRLRVIFGKVVVVCIRHCGSPFVGAASIERKFIGVTRLHGRVQFSLQIGNEHGREFNKRMLDRVSQCRAVFADLRLFTVVNKNGRAIEVLAADSSCARYFAKIQGHVVDEQNATASAFQSEYLNSLRKDGSARGRALREGVPGVLKEVGSGIVIERAGKVYTPLTVVIA